MQDKKLFSGALAKRTNKLGQFKSNGKSCTPVYAQKDEPSTRVSRPTTKDKHFGENVQTKYKSRHRTHVHVDTTKSNTDTQIFRNHETSHLFRKR